MRKCQHSFRQNKKCRTWQIICFKEKRHGILEKYKKSRIFLNLNNISSYIYDITSYIYNISSYIYDITSYIYDITSHIYDISSYIYDIPIRYI